MRSVPVLFACTAAIGGCSAAKPKTTPTPNPQRNAYIASCVLTEARKEGFTTRRTGFTANWVLSRGYQGFNVDAWEEYIYLHPVDSNDPGTVQVSTNTGTASPYVSLANFAPVLDRVMRHIRERCAAPSPQSS